MSLLNQDAILMLFLAGLLDLFGVICAILIAAFGLGVILSYIPDVIGILFFGSWVLIRTVLKGETMEEAKEKASEKRSEATQEVAQHRAKQEMEIRKAKEKLAKKMTKKGVKRGLRFALATLGELIPLIGALPFWTIFVYSELKNS